MKKSLLIFIILVFSQGYIIAQLGIQYNSASATKGYTLFTNFQGTFLIDNCGKIVNEWNVVNVENHCKLLPNGNLLYSKDNTITELDWDGNKIKALLVNQNDVMLDYEVIPMPNGNYLCVGRKPADMSVFRSYGYQNSSSNFTQQDVVVEINGFTGAIVWQWEILDHVVQNRDPSKKAYGVIKENPRKLDINAIATFDWNTIESFMINGMDYNPELDEIAISVRKLSEVVIIDHSTTTAEARGSLGGKHGHGGDAIYRYGNPQNYDQGKLTDRQLYFQHNPNWIQYGEHKGKIMVFNNNLSTFIGYSSVDIFDPVKNADGSYQLNAGDSFQPRIPTKAYNKITTQTDFDSGYTSGGKVLPNGNITITVGWKGKLLEIDTNGKVVWEYHVPNISYIFRTTRYSANYPAFMGRTLTPQNTVESPPSNYSCELVGTVNVLKEKDINLTFDGQQILVDGIDGYWQYRAFNMEGILLNKGKNSHTNTIQLNTPLSAGIYIIQIAKEGKLYTKKLFIY